ncbi:MAG: lipocalin-like domain-containing protein [Kofleriaceae bacterium]
MIPSPYDRAQLPSPLAVTDSEFSWYIFEVASSSRRFAGLVSVHRTGPRARSIAFGPQLLTARDLPAPLSDLVPAWLPILSPLRVETDDRPMLLVALYDLDERTQPVVVEHAVEHFDSALFAARAKHATVDVHGGHVVLRADTPQFTLDLHVTATKPPVGFGPDGSPEIHHGRIATSYIQRPRLCVTGTVELDGMTAIVAGEGVHDHQWLRVTQPNLKWIWPHLRLPDGRELTGYVIRDSLAGRAADADNGCELGRGGWIVDRNGTVRETPFDVRATSHVDTERGRVPTAFVVEASELDVRFEIEHAISAPFIRMQTFGALLDAGIYEGPIEVHGHPSIRGWIEVMNAAHTRLDLATRILRV